MSAERVAVEKVWLNGGTYEWQGKHLDPLSPADGKSRRARTHSGNLTERWTKRMSRRRWSSVAVLTDEA